MSFTTPTPAPAGPPLFLRPAQLQAMIPVSTSTFWRMVKDGRLPRPIKHGGVCLFPVSAVEQWTRSLTP
jgi:predicted DNA-binding transcriptional regulator AlpA